MKKHLLICFLLAIIWRVNGQVSFYDQNKNSIESGTCELNGLEIELTIPTSVANYERVEIIAVYAKNWESSMTHHAYFKRFDGGTLKAGNQSFWIQKPGGGSDFISAGVGNPELDVLYPCNEANRKASAYTVSIRILGGTHTGWENESTGFGSSKTVKAYDYTVLTNHDDAFTIDFGGAASGVTSKSGLVSAGLPFPDETDITTYAYRGGEPFTKGEYVYLRYEDPVHTYSNPIHVKIIGEKKSAVSDWTAEKIKSDILKQLVYSTNRNSMFKTAYDKSEINWHRALTTQKNWFHPAFIKKYGKSGNKSADAQFIAMKDNPPTWKEENGVHVLALDNVYFGDELSGTSAKPYLPEKYKDAKKTLHFYLKETATQWICVGIYKDYNKLEGTGLTDKEAQFITETITALDGE